MNLDVIQKIGNRAVRKAQRNNRKKGIPNVYSKNKVIYFQLPDGSITMNNPFKNISDLKWTILVNSNGLC